MTRITKKNFSNRKGGGKKGRYSKKKKENRMEIEQVGGSVDIDMYSDLHAHHLFLNDVKQFYNKIIDNYKSKSENKIKFKNEKILSHIYKSSRLYYLSFCLFNELSSFITSPKYICSTNKCYYENKLLPYDNPTGKYFKSFKEALKDTKLSEKDYILYLGPDESVHSNLDATTSSSNSAAKPSEINETVFGSINPDYRQGPGAIEPITKRINLPDWATLRPSSGTASNPPSISSSNFSLSGGPPAAVTPADFSPTGSSSAGIASFPAAAGLPNPNHFMNIQYFAISLTNLNNFYLNTEQYKDILARFDYINKKEGKKLILGITNIDAEVKLNEHERNIMNQRIDLDKPNKSNYLRELSDEFIDYIKKKTKRTDSKGEKTLYFFYAFRYIIHMLYFVQTSNNSEKIISIEGEINKDVKQIKGNSNSLYYIYNGDDNLGVTFTYKFYNRLTFKNTNVCMPENIQKKISNYGPLIKSDDEGKYIFFGNYRGAPAKHAGYIYFYNQDESDRKAKKKHMFRATNIYHIKLEFKKLLNIQQNVDSVTKYPTKRPAAAPAPRKPALGGPAPGGLAAGPAQRIPIGQAYRTNALVRPALGPAASRQGTGIARPLAARTPLGPLASAARPARPAARPARPASETAEVGPARPLAVGTPAAIPLAPAARPLAKTAGHAGIDEHSLNATIESIDNNMTVVYQSAEAARQKAIDIEQIAKDAQQKLDYINNFVKQTETRLKQLGETQGQDPNQSEGNPTKFDINEHGQKIIDYLSHEDKFCDIVLKCIDDKGKRKTKRKTLWEIPPIGGGGSTLVKTTGNNPRYLVVSGIEPDVERHTSVTKNKNITTLLGSDLEVVSVSSEEGNAGNNEGEINDEADIDYVVNRGGRVVEKRSLKRKRESSSTVSKETVLVSRDDNELSLTPSMLEFITYNAVAVTGIYNPNYLMMGVVPTSTSTTSATDPSRKSASGSSGNISRTYAESVTKNGSAILYDLATSEASSSRQTSKPDSCMVILPSGSNSPSSSNSPNSPSIPRSSNSSNSPSDSPPQRVVIENELYKGLVPQQRTFQNLTYIPVSSDTATALSDSGQNSICSQVTTFNSKYLRAPRYSSESISQSSSSIHKSTRGSDPVSVEDFLQKITKEQFNELRRRFQLKIKQVKQTEQDYPISDKVKQYIKNKEGRLNRIVNVEDQPVAAAKGATPAPTDIEEIKDDIKFLKSLLNGPDPDEVSKQGKMRQGIATNLLYLYLGNPLATTPNFTHIIRFGNHPKNTTKPTQPEINKYRIGVYVKFSYSEFPIFDKDNTIINPEKFENDIFLIAYNSNRNEYNSQSSNYLNINAVCIGYLGIYIDGNHDLLFDYNEADTNPFLTLSSPDNIKFYQNDNEQTVLPDFPIEGIQGDTQIPIDKKKPIPFEYYSYFFPPGSKIKLKPSESNDYILPLAGILITKSIGTINQNELGEIIGATDTPAINQAATNSTASSTAVVAKNLGGGYGLITPFGNVEMQEKAISKIGRFNTTHNFKNENGVHVREISINEPTSIIPSQSSDPPDCLVTYVYDLTSENLETNV